MKAIESRLQKLEQANQPIAQELPAALIWLPLVSENDNPPQYMLVGSHIVAPNLDACAREYAESIAAM